MTAKREAAAADYEARAAGAAETADVAAPEESEAEEELQQPVEAAPALMRVD